MEIEKTEQEIEDFLSNNLEIMELCNHFYLDFRELNDVKELMPTIRWSPNIPTYKATDFH